MYIPCLGDGLKIKDHSVHIKTHTGDANELNFSVNGVIIDNKTTKNAAQAQRLIKE